MLESTILVISDDSSLIEAVGEVVSSINDLKLVVLPGTDSAYSYKSWDQVALLLIHLRRKGPATDATRLLRMISAARRPVATLMLGEHYDPDQALTLLRLGAADYLGWPDDRNRLAYLIEVLTVRARHGGSINWTESFRPAVPETELEPESTDAGFDVDTQESDRLMNQVRRVAPQETTILLSGETGTGKTRLARLIHDLSSRRAEPFQVVNCGSISPGMIESEMFGQVRGAVSGADHDRSGKFAEAGRGTLFLDEIEALPLSIQAKLLRVVEDRMFEPVGSIKPQPVRARLIAASNRPLEEEVAAMRFRSDLFYRLNVIGFNLPPLRERRGAIPTLVAKFITEFATRDGSEVEAIAEDALRALENFDWPGNIRELRNLIERAVAVCPGREISVGDLPESILKGGSRVRTNSLLGHSGFSLPNVAHTTLAEIKRDAELARITEALEKHSNNRLRAASELGISRMTLYKKLYKYGLMQSHAHTRGGVARA